MCGITGWIDWNKDLTHYPAILESMTETLAPRGPDAKGTWISNHCALGHRRLSVIDPENGAQPMIRKVAGDPYVIVYNGEIYNADELRRELKCRGHRFETTCDTEVVLTAYVEWGKASVERLNGIYAYAVWDGRNESLFLARDRVGVKPLFYSFAGGTFLFGSEMKAILSHPSFHPEVTAEGLAEIFAVGPARTPGHGIFRNMEELRPGRCMELSREGLKSWTYWKLEAREHPDDLDKTTIAVQELLIDTVERQLVSDVPLGTLLSGGLDSSALTTIAANCFKRTGKGELHTYSIDYKDNDKHFKANDFQPNSDNAYIRKMTDFLGTIHHPIQFDTPDLVGALQEAVLARDAPGMADVDSSLLLFCREIKKDITVAISGEAADEVFGGYPWFHREESLNADTFPWSLKLKERVGFLSESFLEWAKPEQYVKERYAEAIEEVPRLNGETAEQARMREMSYLNITRFMPTLLDRKDRMSMRVGLEVRVPFTDHRLIEYVFNIPWELKTVGDREKGLLRRALSGLMPEDVVRRKKSPYPKTHNPTYRKAVKEALLDVLNDDSSPLLPYVDAAKLRQIAENDEQFNLPWFGQLMTGPQLFAYLTSVDYWMRTYQVRVV